MYTRYAKCVYIDVLCYLIIYSEFFKRLSNSKLVCKTGPLYMEMTVHMYFWSILVQKVCICMDIDIYVHLTLII